MAQEIDQRLEKQLYDDVCSIIEETRYRVAVYVNSEASMMNWNVGKRIKEDILLNKRAQYGEQVLKRLSKKLKAKYGSGWGYQKLQHCVRAAYTFSEDEIIYAVRTQKNLKKNNGIQRITARLGMGNELRGYCLRCGRAHNIYEQVVA